MSDTYNTPALRENIKDFENNRNKALSKLNNAYEVLQEALIDCHKAARGKSENTLDLTEDMKKYLTIYKDREPEYYENDKSKPKDKFNKLISNYIDKQIWEHVIESTELDKLFDKQARKEFTDSLINDCPPFTVETCMATIEGLLGDSNIIFQRGVANSFSELDRRFKSHDGFKIGSRMIFDRAFNEWGSWNYHTRKEDSIRDVERVFLKLDNKENCEKYAGIIGDIDNIRKTKGFGKTSFIVENDYFKAKIYLNGNLHLWFKRTDLLRKVNLILANYYGEVIGESSEVANPSDLGPSYHITPAKNYGYFPTSEETAIKLFDRLGIDNIKGLRVLEPSAGCGVLARLVRDKGGDVTCIELQESHSNSLKEQGFNVINKDFLSLTPKDIGYFDIIIANPPFDNGRDSDHLRHMLGFLNEKGRLASIMSASAELSSSSRHSSLREYISKNYKAIDWGDRYYRDLPMGSFKHCGTNVNTITIALKR